MMELIPFKSDHLAYILEVGIRDKEVQPFIKAEHGPYLESVGDTYTILEDGKPLVIGGYKHYWVNRCEAWLLFSENRTDQFISIFKLLKNKLYSSPCKRIEMVVQRDIADLHRWAILLGFKIEAECLKSYWPSGRDVSLYALVRK